MTRTVLYADQAQANRPSVGQRTSPVSFLVRQALDAAQAMFTAPGTRSAETDPWLTANIRRNMSVRAQRLMRADY